MGSVSFSSPFDPNQPKIDADRKSDASKAGSGGATSDARTQQAAQAGFKESAADSTKSSVKLQSPNPRTDKEINAFAKQKILEIPLKDSPYAKFRESFIEYSCHDIIKKEMHADKYYDDASEISHKSLPKFVNQLISEAEDLPKETEIIQDYKYRVEWFYFHPGSEANEKAYDAWTEKFPDQAQQAFKQAQADLASTPIVGDDLTDEELDQLTMTRQRSVEKPALGDSDVDVVETLTVAARNTKDVSKLDDAIIHQGRVVLQGGADRTHADNKHFASTADQSSKSNVTSKVVFGEGQFIEPELVNPKERESNVNELENPFIHIADIDLEGDENDVDRGFSELVVGEDYSQEEIDALQKAHDPFADFDVITQHGRVMLDYFEDDEDDDVAPAVQKPNEHTQAKIDSLANTLGTFIANSDTFQMKDVNSLRKLAQDNQDIWKEPGIVSLKTQLLAKLSKGHLEGSSRLLKNVLGL